MRRQRRARAGVGAGGKWLGLLEVARPERIDARGAVRERGRGGCPIAGTRRPSCAVVIAPADVEFAPDTVMDPDLFVVPLVDGRRPDSWKEVGRLLLAVEVLSAGTMRHDRCRKRPRYQKERVAECWIVDGDARAVERWRPDDAIPEVAREQLSWQPDPAFPPLVIDLQGVFSEGAD